jgi:uncharacterized protein YndB with AHSA1/START domain
VGVEIGPLYARRSVFIDASPARVWAEFVDLPSIATWLGIGQELHLKALRERVQRS